MPAEGGWGWLASRVPTAEGKRAPDEPVRRAGFRTRSVGPARSPLNVGSSHLLNGTHSSKSLARVSRRQLRSRNEAEERRAHPKVRVGDFRESRLDHFELVSCGVQPRVRTMSRLGSEPHRRTVRSSRPRLLVVRSRTMPRESNEDGSVRSVVVVFCIQDVGDGVVDARGKKRSWWIGRKT